MTARHAIAMTVLTFGFLAMVLAAAGVLSWALQASGYNCMMRKAGYERGIGLDDPPSTSKYCEEPRP